MKTLSQILKKEKRDWKMSQILANDIIHFARYLYIYINICTQYTRFKFFDKTSLQLKEKKNGINILTQATRTHRKKMKIFIFQL